MTTENALDEFVFSEPRFTLSVFRLRGAGIGLAVIGVYGLQACFWPARRAARIQPTVALRAE